MWIYEHSQWPDFSWDTEALLAPLANIRHLQGRLLGRMQDLGFDLKQEAQLKTLTAEIVHSSAIEGEHLDRESVRSSIARRLGMSTSELVPASRDIEGYCELMLDATQQYAKPLTKDRLFSWHAALFPEGRNGMDHIHTAQWRKPETDPMQVVSGPMGQYRVHFEAPKAGTLEKEMKRFLAWFDASDAIDPVVKAGIAHFWFVTLHPFEDGNGRLARAISDMALARSDDSPQRYYSLSASIKAQRKGYYQQLEASQRGTPMITSWLLWFIDCLEQAISRSHTILDSAIYKKKTFDLMAQKQANSRQMLIISRMLEDHFQGSMNTSKYAKIAKCSTDTALRDIQKLQEFGLLIQNPGRGRSSSYRLAACV